MGMCKEEGVTLDRTCYLGVCWVLGEGLRKQGFALEWMLPGSGDNSIIEDLSDSYPEGEKTRLRLQL